MNNEMNNEMTYEKAIELFSQENISLDEEFIEAMKLAKKAMTMQIPVKRVAVDKQCGNCDRDLNYYEHENFCPRCGHKIDYSRYRYKKGGK